VVTIFDKGSSWVKEGVGEKPHTINLENRSSGPNEGDGDVTFETWARYIRNILRLWCLTGGVF
jgi:hypothetical protein